MKSSGKQSSNIERRNSTAASPFAKAAANAASKTMFRERARETPFAAAMEKAAKSDHVRGKFIRGENLRRLNEVFAPPTRGPTKARPTRIDAKRAKTFE